MRRIAHACVASLLITLALGCGRWHEFHSVQPYAGVAPAPPVPDAGTSAGPARPLVVVLAGSEGTEIFDLLGPFAILARTGALDVRIVARDTAALPLWRGVALRPQATLAGIDASGRRPVAVVVPNFVDRAQPDVDRWIARYAAEGGTVLAVCEGARIIARAGVLDGRRATSHSEALKRLAKDFDAVHWERGPRWVEDGPVITTAGVSASTEGALLLVERLLGREVRERVMREIAYPDDQLLERFDARGIAFRDKMRLGRRALFGGTGRVFVTLEPGVDELRLAAVLDTWARAFPKSLRTVARDNQWVVTRHGLTVGPTGRWNAALQADELVSPASLDAMEYPFISLARLLTDRVGARTTRTILNTMDLPPNHGAPR